MLNNLRSRLSIGNDWLSTYQKQIKLSKNIIIKDKQIRQELELACQKQNGILTYEEYLTIDQFGKHGYYATSTLHGQTDIETRWGLALAKYCQKNGHDTIIEVGCGTGELGIATIKAYKRITNGQLKWIGVEVDKQIHKKILENFKSDHVQNSVESIVATLDEIPNRQNALIVFPYCLDNIPPQVFLNTKSSDSYPDAILGIIVENGMLSEMIIPQNIVSKKGMRLENGLFTQKGFTYKLSGWKLRKGQRLYLATNIFDTIYSYAKHFKNSSMIIIDEFRNEPWSFSLGTLGTPKSLYEKNLICNERERYYRESGNYNLYFPLYKTSMYKFLSIIGFQSIEYEVEQKMAANLSDKRWFPIGRKYSTFVFISKDFVQKEVKTVSISSPQKRII